MLNLFQQFQRLLPKTPLLVGTVSSVSGDTATVTLLSGNYVVVRGATGLTVSARVFVRDGLYIGPAPTLSTINIEV